MSVERILYLSKTNDKLGRKENKKLADICKETIKEFGQVEVWSKKSNQKISYFKNKEEIYPFWGNTDIALEEPVADSELTSNGVIQEVEYGSYVNSKNQEITIINKVVV